MTFLISWHHGIWPCQSLQNIFKHALMILLCWRPGDVYEVAIWYLFYVINEGTQSFGKMNEALMQCSHIWMNFSKHIIWSKIKYIWLMHVWKCLQQRTLCHSVFRVCEPANGSVTNAKLSNKTEDTLSCSRCIHDIMKEQDNLRL